MICKEQAHCQPEIMLVHGNMTNDHLAAIFSRKTISKLDKLDLLGPLHKGHHFGRVAFADDFNL